MTADPALTTADVGGEQPPDPLYASAEDWVNGHFLQMYRRPIGGEFRWCPQWWRHAEAITRLTALWQSWEAMRLQPGTGMVTWLRDCLDHQLPVLLGRSGPFAQCSPQEHVEPRLAVSEPPPPGWWDADDAWPLSLPAPGPGADAQDDGRTENRHERT
jgi:uncharacterized protein DUF4913